MKIKFAALNVLKHHIESLGVTIFFSISVFFSSIIFLLSMHLLRKKLTKISVALLLLCVCAYLFFLSIFVSTFALVFSSSEIVLVEFFLVCVVSVSSCLSIRLLGKKDQNPYYLPHISSHPCPPSPLSCPLSFPPPEGGGQGGFSVLNCPSSLGLHRYTSLLLGAPVRVNTRGPGRAGLRGGLPLSPESLWWLRHIR